MHYLLIQYAFPFLKKEIYRNGEMHDCSIRPLREDTHKKVFFFSGWTTKGVRRVNPPDH